MNNRKLLYLIMGIFFLTTKTNAQNDPEISLKLKGDGKEGIAIMILNQSPISFEINKILKDFVVSDFRVALVPKNYVYDLNAISKETSPFAKDIKYVVKIIVNNQSSTEQLLNLNVEVLRISDGKILSNEVAGPRSHLPIITKPIKKMLLDLMPITPIDNPQVISNKGNNFVFLKNTYPNLRRGDEITIRYAEPRLGLTESIAIVHQFSNDTVIAKDINKQVQEKDTILRNNPKRNRFYLNIGIIVPTIGEKVLSAQYENNIWESTPYWPVGFQITGEYERFLPYQLVSTTVFGINVDKTVGTYLMTGIGYRILYSSWEFTPYFRLGGIYNSIGLKIVQGDKNNLQGFALRLGFNLGINIVHRLDNSMFIGLDIGAQYFPFAVVAVVSDSTKIKPQWKYGQNYTDAFSMTEFYPYLNIKIGWLF